MEALYWLTGSQIVILLVAVFKIWGKSYISEKGKNLAQKEDIEEITDKIEAIKALYTKENDEIKQQLTYIFGIQSSHRTEERNAIVHFHEVYYHWLYTLLEIPITNYNTNTINSLLDKRKELSSYFLEINKATSKMSLLVKNKELLQLSNSLIMELIKFKTWIEERLLKLEFLLQDDNSLHTKFTKLLIDYEKNKEELRKLADKEITLTEEKRILVEGFLKDKVAEFRKCITISKEFEELAKTYLTSIS
jgi:hypothetical protein